MVEMIVAAVILVIGIIGGVILNLVSNEISEYCDPWARWILKFAVALQPEEERERRQEEWAAHINECPGKLMKIYTALDILRTSRVIASDLAHAQGKPITIRPAAEKPRRWVLNGLRWKRRGPTLLEIKTELDNIYFNSVRDISARLEKAFLGPTNDKRGGMDTENAEASVRVHTLVRAHPDLDHVHVFGGEEIQGGSSEAVGVAEGKSKAVAIGAGQVEIIISKVDVVD